MKTVLASAVLLSGAAFTFLAALGVARLPDLYTRMQAATKAATVGVAAMMTAVAIAHAEASVTIRAILIAGFFLLTSPVAAHAIARSAHTRGVPLARGTWTDRGVPSGDGAGERADREQQRAAPSSPDLAGGERRRPHAP